MVQRKPPAQQPEPEVVRFIDQTEPPTTIVNQDNVLQFLRHQNEAQRAELPTDKSESTTEIIDLNQARAKQEAAKQKQQVVEDQAAFDQIELPTEVVGQAEDDETNESRTQEPITDRVGEIQERITEYFARKLNLTTELGMKIKLTKAIETIHKLEDAFVDMLMEKRTNIREYELFSNHERLTQWERIFKEIQQDNAASFLVPDGIDVHMTRKDMDHVSLTAQHDFLQNLRMRLEDEKKTARATKTPAFIDQTRPQHQVANG